MKMSFKSWRGFGSVFVSDDLRRTNEQLLEKHLNVSECYALQF